MSVRIRYSVTNEANVLESTRVFNTTTNSYRVRLNTTENSYVIFDVNGDIIAASGTRRTLPLLKKAVKAALVELGYNFNAETRNRTEAEAALSA